LPCASPSNAPVKVAVLVAAAMEYVDYRRYADYLRPAGSDVIDGARGRSRRGLHQAQVQEEEKESPVAAPIGPKRLPVWWLFFLPLYWFPQSINFGLIQTYLLCVSLAWRPSIAPPGPAAQHDNQD
jgi:hypothetical protein